MSVSITITLPLDDVSDIQRGLETEHSIIRAKNALITAVNALPCPNGLVEPVVIKVSVKTMMGKTVQVSVKSEGTVSDLKAAIQDKEGIPTDQQRLLFKGNILKGSLSLAEVRSILSWSRPLCVANTVPSTTSGAATRCS